MIHVVWLLMLLCASVERLLQIENVQQKMPQVSSISLQSVKQNTIKEVHYQICLDLRK
uniref:Uncharacterized protein n=1 Tax=virus sp. ctBS918 TaxID=2825807 RepID=A0A8S5RNP6_9VIRU|nr:MAG TPA: hypothetical protein [virus sp. ctBS918]